MTAETTKAVESTTVLPDINLEAITSGEILKDLSSFDGLFVTMGVEWGMRLLAAITILIVGWVVGNWIDRRFDRIKRLDSTLKNFLGALFKYMIIVLSIVTVIGLFGIPMTSLLAVLGAAGLAIGLALQGTLANIASGVMLLILRPFNVGDYIEFGNEGGTVKTLGLFGTELAKADIVYVFAPNSRIWGNEIRNYSRNLQRRQDISVSISYDDDLNKALEVITRVLEEDERILQQPDNKKPQVVTDKMSDYTIDLIVRFWSSTDDYWDLRWAITKKIKQELEKSGISLPLTPRQMAIEG